MLGLTHQTKTKTKNWINKEPNFEPFILFNNPNETSLNKQQKLIQKVTSTNENPRSSSKEFIKDPIKAKSPASQKNQWDTGGRSRGLFDTNLGKNQLAVEQRRLRAEKKIQKQLNHQQIIINQKKIGGKAIKMMKQKDDQIEYLKQMIEKEKQEKAKIDKLYEQKKQQIQKERQELIQLERKIQKEGVKQKKIVRQINRLNSPQKDGRSSKFQRNLSSQISPRQAPRQQTKRSYEEPTQSELLHQKNMVRQKQLDYLMFQREKAVKGLPNINYTPTLIPLLSKASYKIVSTHVSQIVELLIDELLEQQVYLLEQIELEEAKIREQQKSKQMLNQYCSMVNNFVDENEDIANKIGKYSTMNFSDFYKPKHYSSVQERSRFAYDPPNTIIFRKINLEAEFDEDCMEEIQNRRDRFHRFVANFDEYKKPSMEMFTKCVEQTIDQAIEKIAKQLDKGSGQFVDIVFRNEFK